MNDSGGVINAKHKLYSMDIFLRVFLFSSVRQYAEEVVIWNWSYHSYKVDGEIFETFRCALLFLQRYVIQV